MHDFTKYFKEQKGFDRFINELHKKYQSLSKFSGTLKLNKLNKEEARVFSKLFGRVYKENDSISIFVKDFIKIMENSKYEDFNIEILVSEYLNTELITNKDKKRTKTTEEKEFYLNIVESSNGIGNKWLKEVIETKSKPYQLIHKRYNKNKKELNSELNNIVNLINNLPKENTLISIFSSNYTKDPHYLDIDGPHSTLFLYALSYTDKVYFPKSRLEKIELLSKYNIEVDTISNFAITYNLLSDKQYINEATKEHEPLLLNIQNILNTKYLDTKNKKVFVFENPSILTEIITKGLDVGVVISGGFTNTSVYLILDKLIQRNNKLYYNGDFDPEGLLIAKKMRDKYRSNLELFCYTEEDYKNCISDKKINYQRLNKLDIIKQEELLEIKKLLLKNQSPAYQENNKDKLIEFIEKNKKMKV